MAFVGWAVSVYSHNSAAESRPSLLGVTNPTTVGWEIVKDTLPALSAAGFLVFYVELRLRQRNLLQGQHAGQLRQYAVKLLVISCCLAFLQWRCQQVCDGRTYLTVERSLTQFRRYLRVFAAGTAAYSILVSALNCLKQILLRPTGHTGSEFGELTAAVAAVAGIGGVLSRLDGARMNVLAFIVNFVAMPALLVFGLWHAWVPQLAWHQQLLRLSTRLYRSIKQTSHQPQEL